MSATSRTETEDGTYYYVEVVRTRSGLPRLLRTEMRAGVPYDAMWRVDTDDWERTLKLSDYRLNLEENEIQPVTERLAQEIQEKKRQHWRGEHPDD